MTNFVPSPCAARAAAGLQPTVFSRRVAERPSDARDFFSRLYFGPAKLIPTAACARDSPSRPQRGPGPAKLKPAWVKFSPAELRPICTVRFDPTAIHDFRWNKTVAASFSQNPNFIFYLPLLSSLHGAAQEQQPARRRPWRPPRRGPPPDGSGHSPAFLSISFSIFPSPRRT